MSTGTIEIAGPRIGSLCSGVGGLDMAVEAVFGGSVAWFFEYEEAPSKVLAYRWPDVPNYGDVTKAKWAPDCPECGEQLYVERGMVTLYRCELGCGAGYALAFFPDALEVVDIACGGTPCQDLSGAGKRAGMTEGTRSNLWVQMREGIAIQRPAIVVWENVRGAYSAGADSEVERTEGLLGGTPGGSLRALGRVLGDLSSLGYDARVVPLRASDVGAPHGRFRVFVIAYRNGERLSGLGRINSEGRNADRRSSADPAGIETEPSALPTDSDNIVGYGSGRAWHGREEFADGHQPVSDSDNTGRGEQRGPVTVRAEQSASQHDGDAVSDSGCDEPERRGGSRVLGSTSGAGEGEGHQRERLRGSAVDSGAETGAVEWGAYEPAIARWEAVLGRRAPAPTRGDGRGGGHRLSAHFVEWMMGLSDGWVTAPEIGLTRNEQLKALGNGVVPQQATAAIRIGASSFADLEQVAA